jgi:hypothetical protein
MANYLHSTIRRYSNGAKMLVNLITEKRSSLDISQMDEV